MKFLFNKFNFNISKKKKINYLEKFVFDILDPHIPHLTSILQHLLCILK